jgi:hypothetical protein
MALEDKVKDYIWDHLSKSVVRSLQNPGKSPDYYDRQVERVDRLLKRLDEVEGKRPAAAPPVATAVHQPLPTKEETVAELKRRLTKELYKAELDLANGLRIAGKPCTCLDPRTKHTLMLEAAAEELISEEPDNPVYRDIIRWIGENQHKLTVEAIASGKYDQEYPQMAAQFRDFRKRVAGSLDVKATMPFKGITLEEAQKLAAEEAKKEVALRWAEGEPGA